LIRNVTLSSFLNVDNKFDETLFFKVVARSAFTDVETVFFVNESEFIAKAELNPDGRIKLGISMDATIIEDNFFFLFLLLVFVNNQQLSLPFLIINQSKTITAPPL